MGNGPLAQPPQTMSICVTIEGHFPSRSYGSSPVSESDSRARDVEIKSPGLPDAVNVLNIQSMRILCSREGEGGRFHPGCDAEYGRLVLMGQIDHPAIGRLVNDGM